jgi:hypothetical protein
MELPVGEVETEMQRLREDLVVVAEGGELIASSVVMSPPCGPGKLRPARHTHPRLLTAETIALRA